MGRNLEQYLMTSTAGLIPGSGLLSLSSEPPFLAFLKIIHLNGSVLFVKTRSEERESGTGKTFVGDDHVL